MDIGGHDYEAATPEMLFALHQQMERRLVAKEVTLLEKARVAPG